MSKTARLPMAVLSERLADQIDGRRVRTALFTTFNFDPGFFELNVLPLLFDQSFSQVDKVRLIQLEDALRSVEHLGVYYDRSALAQDAEPARLSYQRLDVRRSTGAFHPKLILLLVDEPPDEDDEVVDAEPLQSLIVVVQSANLTRAGWWENLECSHIEEIPDRDLADERCAFRQDLLAILRRVERSAEASDDQPALESIRTFLRTRAAKGRISRAKARGRFHTRLFGGEGAKNLADWLGDLRLSREAWNLEVISPYFDPHGAGPLEALIDAANAKETRVYLPKDVDGTALVTERTYTAIAECAWWSEFPAEVLARRRGAGGERLMPRRVHAKVYRLWQRGGPDLVITGSVNLTESGHSHGGAGNLEAAFFIDASELGSPSRWWLNPIEEEARRFAEEAPAEDHGLDPVPVDLSFRFDWADGTLAYRLGGSIKGGLEIQDIAGMPLFRIDKLRAGNWVPCPAAASEIVRKSLRSSSFLVAHHPRGTWRVLVREEHMAHRPSLLADLTPEEILEYWSLLTPEQRAAFLEEHGARGLYLEGISVAPSAPLESRDTLFDQFGGLYHAFGALRRHVKAAIDEGRPEDAEARLFGAKYDSLPVLLERTLNREDGDPVLSYVTFLSAAQLAAQVRKRHKDFYRECRKRTARLDELLGKLPEVRQSLPLDAMADAEAFLDWYEPMFLADIGSKSTGV